MSGYLTLADAALKIAGVVYLAKLLLAGLDRLHDRAIRALKDRYD